LCMLDDFLGKVTGSSVGKRKLESIKFTGSFIKRVILQLYMFLFSF
jgi:hypothetical protein